jgi:hypothetical protein
MRALTLHVKVFFIARHANTNNQLAVPLHSCLPLRNLMVAFLVAPYQEIDVVY